MYLLMVVDLHAKPMHAQLHIVTVPALRNPIQYKIAVVEGSIGTSKCYIPCTAGD